MFPCEKCGCCCRNIGKAEFAENMALPDGSCKFLDKTSNLCGIYESRPIFCRVDEFYEKFLSHFMTLDEFYGLNKECCKKFQMSQKTSRKENFEFTESLRQ